jgi:hypothetical protein
VQNVVVPDGLIGTEMEPALRTDSMRAASRIHA